MVENCILICLSFNFEVKRLIVIYAQDTLRQKEMLILSNDSDRHSRNVLIPSSSGDLVARLRKYEVEL